MLEFINIISFCFSKKKKKCVDFICVPDNV
jgi:hypothetical protein